ncbi:MULTISPECIES: TetR/AcrR family transcriptional regulator [unclassified Bradyrhizobium]|uniref:TetR/AcrR family transcriptional regulator n=1 Tax=unclassified Bradyrhizobium TaxID=2631580 RepID=UPI0028E8CEA0|nr:MULTISPECIES: TetR/AcrR family transcriptional regulator [unclassified Bradyrhizobium]
MTKPSRTKPVRKRAVKEPRPYHHGDLRRALIVAATELLEREGAEALSFRAVARTAGVSQSAPYNHFSGKEDLLATVAEAGFRALASSQAETAARVAAGEQRMIALGLDYIGFAAAHPQLYRLMFGVGVPDWHAYPQVSEAKQASFVPIRAALAESSALTSSMPALDHAAVAAWGLAHGLAMLRIDGSLGRRNAPGAIPPEEGALRLFARGLRYTLAGAGGEVERSS